MSRPSALESTGSPGGFDEERWRKSVEEFRQRKDDLFRNGPESPIRESRRASFPGLPYYPPDPALRVAARFERIGNPPRLLLDATGGKPQEYVRRATATLRFPMGAPEIVGLFARALDVTKSPDALFFPFRDATCGRGSNPSGRFLDLPNPFLGQASSIEGVVDFNFAYNPYCVYDDCYVCPLPPRENWLKSAVAAGEKTPPGVD